MFDYDLLVALGLIVIVVFVLFLVKIGLLPKKSLPFVLGAMLGIFGFSLWREHRMKKLRQELWKREAELKKREEILKKLKEDYQASEQELAKARAELQKHREAYQKAILQLNAQNEQEKERIDQLFGDALQDEFSKLLGS
jgi:septal ring factor EnvC (AmiA/AmiB activator)